MEERQSRLSSMVWRRFQQYFCVRLIPQNSMFSNFCHVLNVKTYKITKLRCGKYVKLNAKELAELFNPKIEL